MGVAATSIAATRAVLSRHVGRAQAKGDNVNRNLAIVLAALVSVATAIAVPSASAAPPNGLPAAAYSHNVCGPPAAGTAACHARLVDVDAGGPGHAPTPDVSQSPAGLTP